MSRQKPPFLSSHPLPPLRVARACSCPARPRICSSGDAGRSRDGIGAHGPSVDTRYRFCFLAALSLVAYGVLPSPLSRYLVRSSPSDGHDLVKLQPGVLPWWWALWGRESEGTCLNKLEGGGPSDLVDFGSDNRDSTAPVFPPPTRRGGAEERGTGGWWSSRSSLHQGRSSCFSREVCAAQIFVNC